VKKTWFSIGVFALISIYHFGSSWAPLPVSDEAALADFALHQDITLFREILPKSQNIVRYAYGFGLFPLHMGILRSSLHVFGIGVTAVRLPAIISGLISLALIMWLTRRLRYSRWFLAGWIFLGTGTLFFLTTHTARAEALILLILTANLAWVYLRGDPRTGFFLGLAAAVSLLIYPAACFTLITVVVVGWLDDGQRMFSQHRYRTWCLGVILGLLCIPFFIDIEQANQYFQFQRLIYRGAWVAAPGLLRVKGDLLAALYEGLRLLVRAGEVGSAWHVGLIAILLAMMMWQLRRYRQLHRQDRVILTTGITLWAAYAVFHVSDNQPYAIYLYPWWIWNGMILVSRLIKRTLVLDELDLVQLGIAVLLVVAPPDRWMRELLLLTLFFACALEPRKVFPGRIEGAVQTFTALGFLMIAGAAALTDNGRIPERVRAAASIQLQIRAELPALRNEEKVIAPMTLWLYAPDIRMQSLDFIIQGRPFLNTWNPLPWIQDYKPGLILWPEWDVDRLLSFRNPHGLRLRLADDRVWRIPALYGARQRGLTLGPKSR
jgi:hypothetical protein